MSIMLIMSCHIGFFNVRRGWQSLNTEPRFYLRLIRRTGWLWIHTSRTTDERPFKQKKLSVPFLYPGVPARLTPFRGLVPLGRRNLVPILPPEHPLVTLHKCGCNDECSCYDLLLQKRWNKHETCHKCIKSDSHKKICWEYTIKLSAS
jgi:hypothetical protein